MIKPKDFLEFAEREWGVKLVDDLTGRPVLELMAEREAEMERNKNCLSCQWCHNGNGVWLHEKDTVCVNAGSENVTEWVNKEMVCEHWEPKTEDKRGKK